MPPGLRTETAFSTIFSQSAGPSAVKNLRKPGHVIGAGNRIIQKIAGLKPDAAGKSEAFDSFERKGSGGRKIVYRCQKIRIGQAEMNRIGAGSSAEIQKILSYRQGRFEKRFRAPYAWRY